MIPLRDYTKSRTFPAVTVTLIIINLLVFSYQLTKSSQETLTLNVSSWQAYHMNFADLKRPVSYVRISPREEFLFSYGFIPGELLARVDLPPRIPFPLWVTLFTAMFIHGGLLHILGNMLYLWIFGDNVEDAMGHGKFLAFYLLCGLIATATQSAISPHSAIPQIGASGAIAGVLAAYFMLYPYSRVLTLIPIFFFIRLIRIPAAILLGFWFMFQVISGAGAIGASGGGVAFFAHIGGFIAGGLLVFAFRRRGIPVVLWEAIRRRH
ncbi:MAG TPA: rhomboid family intramembrane serine protease [Candidatus Acetothermia bacterium]|nr:rhomboid family intramembrane serine protease [Candidatus Acetothermia bacterium]